MEKEDVFNISTQIVDEKLQITTFEVVELNSEVINLLDDNVIKICEGENSFSDIAIVKTRLKKLFSGKNNTWKMGAIAEFFIHLFIHLSGYKQECMFFNLEERSIKKGFDGFYNNGQQWIMESKSGSINTKGISHGSKINEAVIDLKEKFSGNVKNNPWLNAYNHASHCDVGSSLDIRKSIKLLSEEFTKGQFHKMEQFNIMPCATIFLDKIWIPRDREEIIEEVKKVINKNDYKKAHLVCVTQANIRIFEQYMNLS